MEARGNTDAHGPGRCRQASLAVLAGADWGHHTLRRGLVSSEGPKAGHTGRSLTGKKKRKVFRNQFSQKSPRALHVLNHGWWQLAVGGWWLAAVGGWQLATGGWWRLAAVGGW